MHTALKVSSFDTLYCAKVSAGFNSPLSFLISLIALQFGTNVEM